MQATKADIIARLQQQLAPLQGVRPTLGGIGVEAMAGPHKPLFPNGILAFGAIHEFISEAPEQTAATGGFIAAVLATLMKKQGAAIWIGAQQSLFPPALPSFGIRPERVIFLELKKQKDILWATEEALKCHTVAGVVCELPEISFATSRRLQLTVEESGVMGFLIRQSPKNIGITASVTRWQIRPLPSEPADAMPGVGFPRWNASLLRIRNGKPAEWQVEWKAGRFKILPQPAKTKIITNAFSQAG